MIDCCNATLYRFHDQDDFFGEFEKRFVVFYKPLLSKRVTRPPKRRPYRGMFWKCNNTPENMLKYAAPVNPSLFELIG